MFGKKLLHTHGMEASMVIRVLKSPTEINFFPLLKDAVTALSWSKNKQYVAAGSAKGTLRVYNMQDMSTTATVDKGHQGNP